MKLQLQQQEIQDIWHELEGAWAEQDTYGVSAQILLGADQARSFPHKARDKNGDIIQTEQAQLMQSTITGSYIILWKTFEESKQNLVMDRSQPSTSVKLGARG